MKRIAVIGAGGWGTALAIIAARNTDGVSLWSNNSQVIEAIKSTGENSLYLPGIGIPASVKVTHSVQDAIGDARMVITAVPSQVHRSVFKRIAPFLTQEMVIVSATKGIENDSLMRISEIVRAELSDRFTPAFAALSGPTFSMEVAKEHPTAAVVASANIECAEQVQKALSTPTLRLYTNSDLIGVELCGAVKNIIALAAGMASGLGYGNNSIAAVVTRGMAEIARLVIAKGGRAETVAGLAGVGDLMLTCFGSLSRNRHVGVELGKGRSLEDITGDMREIAEGISTTKAAAELAGRTGIEMPIIEKVHEVLYQGLSPRNGMRSLMERPLKGE